VICALLAMLFVVAWQHDRVVREHVELARVDLELQERLREAKRAEDDTRRLTQAFDNAGEPVMVTDRWGTLEYVNHAFEHLLGFSSADVLGKRLVDFVPPDEAQRLEPLIAKSHKTVWSRRIRCRHRDGERLRLDITVSPVFSAEEQAVVNYIVLARDVRGDMQLEERTLQARKLEAVGRLAGGLAHDFNNVLQVILGYAGEMMESIRQPEQRDNLSQILAAGQLGSELTSRLIAFSRQQISHREIADINDTIRTCAPTIQKRLGSNVDLQLDLEPKLWQTLLDASRFEQVLVQLAENARDATPDGGTVTIRTSNATFREPTQTVISDLPSGEYVRTDVTDTGRGIPPEDLEQIFEPLFTTRQQGGLKGLGLCVVHGTIAQHGGGIIVDSRPGHGTTFQLYLPRCVNPSQGTADDSPEVADAQPGEGKVILLAEDEEPVRHVAARLLAKVGYEVLEAVDGNDAIAKFDGQRDRIDLALLDIVMPGVSGAVVAGHIRRASPETPILFCSGYAKHQLPDGIDLPRDIPLVGKPYEPRRLLGAIAELLGGK
jgi:PAS domain S-box-containing protein